MTRGQTTTMIRAMLALSALLMGGCPGAPQAPTDGGQETLDTPVTQTPPAPKNYDGWWEMTRPDDPTASATVHIVNDRLVEWRPGGVLPALIITANPPSQRINSVAQWVFEEPSDSGPGLCRTTIEMVEQSPGVLVGSRSVFCSDGSLALDTIILTRM